MRFHTVKTLFYTSLSTKLSQFSLKCFPVRTMTSERSDHLQRTAENKRQEIISHATVVDVSEESKTVKRLTLNIHDKLFSFKPGQWVDMFIPGVDIVGGYSICSSPEQLLMSHQIQLAVKNSKHPPAHWIHTKCKKGSHVNLRVGGDFYFQAEISQDKPDLLLIAGGIGITPLFSIWQHCRDLNVASSGYSDVFGRLLLLYSASSKDELIFNREIREIEDLSTNIHCQRFVTKEEGENTGINYRRINTDDVAKAFHWLKQDRTKVFICGPSPMVSDMEKILDSVKFPKNRIFYEKWW